MLIGNTLNDKCSGVNTLNDKCSGVNTLNDKCSGVNMLNDKCSGVGLQRGGQFPVNFRKVSGKFPREVKLGNFGYIPYWKLSMGIMGIMGTNGNLGELTGNILYPSININRSHKKTSTQNVFNRYFNRFICK